ncbi:MAG: hypothetical protein L6R43_20280, partial [Planctomycetes bacterium]|nr:hypothetical protein [Planctomycetota bacterium]
LYGVGLGDVYFGESMFALAPDASKVAFTALVVQLRRWGFTLIDSQVYTDHLHRFGAQELPRERYLQLLTPAVRAPWRKGRWAFDGDLNHGGLPVAEDLDPG